MRESFISRGVGTVVRTVVYQLAFSYPGQIMRGVNMLARILPAVALLLPSAWIHADEPPPIKVLAVISKAKDHQKMMVAAGPVLEELGRENHFSVDVTDDGSRAIHEAQHHRQDIIKKQTLFTAGTSPSQKGSNL